MHIGNTAAARSSRPTARCCTISAMRESKNRHLQTGTRGLRHLLCAYAAGGSQCAFATTSYVIRPDAWALLAAVFLGALIVLIAVAVVQRRHGDPGTPSSGTEVFPTPMPPPVGVLPLTDSDTPHAGVTELQAALGEREQELATRTRELARRTRECEDAARELDSLAHSVSHDLRAPLRIVDGFATIVLEDYGDRGKQLDDLGRDHLRRIVAAGQRMNTMIDTLLNLSRMTSRELSHERVDLSQIARELSDDLRDDMRAREPARSIEFVIAPSVRVDGDPTLLRLVLQNLLGNAAKFSAKTRLARVEFGRNSNVDGAENYAVFFVRDNGAGFDMRFAEKMFGMFQRLHSSNEFAGSGVGLATVQKIIRRHGGRIWAEAVPAPTEGHGATFYFTLWETGAVADRN